ncbi:MAG TPA: elongation factor P maturation arginine rhamnosyltransferase EarP [Usitatibacter sp.]|nr:elongation factor P maturation arginine rhamnosyltransferase EarP [Usitatibacter sp.]
MPAADRWDIFCRVVDNFGDVGVSWRLARMIAREHGKRVRLFVDDLAVLSRLRPEVDRTRDIQALEDVEIHVLREPFAAGEIADVVVETFGCDPPQQYVEAMAKREPRPRWINLEYLSAEDWVEGSHALPSPNPRLPLVKHYFFPGFTRATGGLLRERDLLRRRFEFQRDAGAQAVFWQELVGRTPPEGALKVSLFAYAGAPLEALVSACAQHAGPVWLVVPDGPATAGLKGRGEVEVIPVPFLPQDRYDVLLWACDVNFVRGEDSFVRAQWAARPFVWQIYPTQDGAHWIKLAAFLTRYTAPLPRDQAAAVTAMWEAWNARGDMPDPEPARPALAHAWAGFIARREALLEHARDWAQRLGQRTDLASAIVDFADNVLK